MKSELQLNLHMTVNADGTVGEAADPQPDPTGLSPRSSSSYRTVDKAIPFQSVEVLNEHTVRKYYVDVNKFWNDAGIKDLTATGVNDYARIKLKYALHGVTDNGRGGTDTVDLNDDPDKEDLEIELDPGETNTRNKVIDTYYVFKDSSGKEYVRVLDGDTVHTAGYYEVSGGTVDYSTPAEVKSSDLKAVINPAYKTDANNFFQPIAAVR